MDESTLAHYHHWMFKNGSWESVVMLKEFVVQGAKFQRVALEIIQ